MRIAHQQTVEDTVLLFWKLQRCNPIGFKHAGMAELADALDLGSSAVKGVQVQVLFPAP